MPLIQRPTKIIIQPGEGSSSRSYSEEDSFPHDENDLSLADDDEEWQDDDDYDDLHPSDSASASNEPPPFRSRAQRPLPRRRPSRQQQQFHPVTHAPGPPSSVAQDEYGHYGRGGGYQPQPQHGHGGFYGGRGHAPGYHQNHAAPYMGGYPSANQMVPYANYGSSNPFSPMSNGSSGASYFGGEPPRGMYDMQPYQQQAYYGGGPQYNLPAHMQQFHLSPPPPPATEHPGQSATPGPREAPLDPEKIRLEAELAALKAMEEKSKAAEKQRNIEAQIRRDAEESFRKRMEDMRLAQEEAKKEIEKARAEAERVAREKIAAERKAEEDRARQHAEAMKRAEENARLRFESELKVADERRKKEEEDRARAEIEAQLRLEKAIKAEAEARAAAERKAKEEADRLKQIHEDAKIKAENEARAKVEAEKAAAIKKAADEEIAKKEAEANKKRIQEETMLKLEEAAKKKQDKAPIKFKDAVGRKFSFPFHLCSTWTGMEELIKQAFLQVDVLGPHVQEGHYDLTGPNGEIILPSVWEKVIEPDWSITMTMWPVDKNPPPRMQGGMPHGMDPRDPRRHHAHGPPFGPGPGVRMGGMPPGGLGGARRQGGNPPMPPGWGGPGLPGDRGRPGSGLPPNVVNVGPQPRPSSKSKRNNSAMLKFLAGKPKKKSSSKK